MIDRKAVHDAMTNIELLEALGAGVYNPDDWPVCPDCGEPVAAHWRKVGGAMVVRTLHCSGCAWTITADREVAPIAKPKGKARSKKGRT